MTRLPAHLTEHATCNLVEILTAEETGDVFAYRTHGTSPGPSLVAMGQTSMVDAIFSEVLPRPDFSQMRGQVTLVETDALHGPGCDAHLREIVQGPMDRVLVLPGIMGPTAYSKIVKHGGDTLIAACRRLGMLPGEADRQSHAPFNQIVRALGHRSFRPRLV